MSIEYEAAVEADQITDEPLERDLGLNRLVETPWRRVRRRFRRNIPAMVAVGIMIGLVLVAIFAPLLAPYDPNETSTAINEGPSAEHWLGTDSTGRDILSRLIYGARASLQVATMVVTLAALVAIPLGLISGYFGRWYGATIDRVTDALFTFPPLTLALAVAALLGPSLVNASLALAIVFVPGFVRIVRAQVIAIRSETFIEASRSIGVSNLRMLRKHVFPNVASPLIVQAALAYGFAIGAEAGLSLLGLGVQPPTASWGTMLQDAYGNLTTTTWPLVPPVVALLLAILACNLIGDGLRDALGRESFAMGTTA